jgi:radical SAM-linked protein
MKLYFMIGLPTEEESDVREIVKVGKRARETGRRVKKERNLGGAPKVTVSVSTHVPKPHTPFQWCAMDPASLVREKQGWLEDEARVASGVDLRMHDCDTSWLEGVFARGDRALSLVLERAFRNGARFDSWEDQLRIEVWEEAFQHYGIDVAKYLGTIPVTARLPWDHISVGLEDGFLAREYRKAVKSRLSVPCGKVAGMFVHHTNLDDANADTKKLVCYDCGVACDLSAMRSERLVYLTKLGAKSKVLPKPLPPPSTKATGKKGPPPRIEQGAARRYRFLYTKLGPSAFLAHLDLIRALPRAYRRINVPLFYSSGYHPKPEMTFGPALSLGVSSLCELVDVKLTCDIDPTDILEGLTRGSAEGIRFVGGVRLGENDAAIPRVVDAARYVVGVPRVVLAERGGEEWLDQEIKRLLDATEHKILRRIDGIGKWVDVRAYLRGITRQETATALSQAGILGDLAGFRVDLEIRGSGAVKISEVVEALGADLPFRAVRVAMGTWLPSRLDIASPMDLVAVRKRPSSDAAGAMMPGHAETL